MYNIVRFIELKVLSSNNFIVIRMTLFMMKLRYQFSNFLIYHTHINDFLIKYKVGKNLMF